MQKACRNIWFFALVLIQMALTLAPARAQTGNTVLAGQSSILAVEEFPGTEYYWELYDDVSGLNLAVDPGNCPAGSAYFVGGVQTGDSVEVMWLVPGYYFFKVTATDSCSRNIKLGIMEVLVSESYATFLEPESVCEGDTATLTLEITGGPGPWDVTYTDGTDSWTINGITVSPYSFQLVPTPSLPGSYTYQVTSVTNVYGITNNIPSPPVTLIIRPRPVTSPIYRY